GPLCVEQLEQRRGSLLELVVDQVARAARALEQLRLHALRARRGRLEGGEGVGHVARDLGIELRARELLRAQRCFGLRDLAVVPVEDRQGGGEAERGGRGLERVLTASLLRIAGGQREIGDSLALCERDGRFGALDLEARGGQIRALRTRLGQQCIDGRTGQR